MSNIPNYAFDLTAPCFECPFRNDKDNMGSPEWAEDVLKILTDPYLSGGHTCHKTDINADNSLPEYKGPVQHCAGLSILLKKEQRATAVLVNAISLAVQSNQDLPGWDILDMNAPVHSKTSMIDACLEVVIADHFPKSLTGGIVQ